MRVTIIPVDGVVIVNGRAFDGIDMSSVDPAIHAVQWYGDRGEVEFKERFIEPHKATGGPDPENEGKLLIVDVPGAWFKDPNAVIDSLDEFQTVLDQWEAKRNAADIPPPLVTADELAKKVAEIDDWRDREEQTSIIFEHAERRWDGGLATRQRLTPVIALSALPEGFYWTDADNNDVQMDLAQLQALHVAHESAIVAHGFNIHDRQRQMKREVQALADANDAAGIAAYVVGWSDEEGHENA